MGSPASTIQVDHSSTPVPGDNRILSNQHTPSTSDRTPLKKGLKLKNLRPTSPRRRPHMYVFLLLNFGRDLDPGPNTRGTLAHTRASVRQTLATLSKHLRCSRLNTWPKLCYPPRRPARVWAAARPKTGGRRRSAAARVGAEGSAGSLARTPGRRPVDRSRGAAQLFLNRMYRPNVTQPWSYAPAMPVVCAGYAACYAAAVCRLCDCRMPAMRPPYAGYAAAMWLLCGCYAAAMRRLCGGYAGRMPAGCMPAVTPLCVC